MEQDNALFECLNCGAQYQVVEEEAGPETVYSELTCLNCGAPLPNREGKSVVKYFLERGADE